VLARERKRALWSLAIGVIIVPAALSFWYLRAQAVDVRLQSLVANCEKEASASNSKGFTIVTPEEWKRTFKGPPNTASRSPGAPPDAVSRIRDSSGAVIGYRMKDGSIKRFEFEGKSTAISPEEAKRLWANRLGGPEKGYGGPSIPLPPGFKLAGFKPICDPGSLMSLPELKGESAQIVNAALEADNDRDNGRLFGLAALLLSCLPLFWYFLLDRIREVSAAISGRDRRE
jgi:hypothetical protein